MNAGEIAQAVMYLPGKHEGPMFTSQAPTYMSAEVYCLQPQQWGREWAETGDALELTANCLANCELQSQIRVRAAEENT